jgi:hypothetical protein
MKRFLRDNGLTLTLMTLFLLFLAGQVVTGLRQHNEEQLQHGEPEIGLRDYLTSGSFIEATAENWESEFLQMAGYVLLTTFLFQRGSAESRKLSGHNDVDRDPRRTKNPRAPWPVKRGGWILRLYENSLSIALLLLFLISFVLHAAGGARAYNEEQLAHGSEPMSTWQYLATARFWFESFQNWQSEFLAIAAMVWLSIYLRQRHSPESKPVDAPHDETG